MTPRAPTGPPDAAWEHLARAQDAVEAGRPDLIRDHVRAGLAVVAGEELELRLRLTGTAWTVEDRGPSEAFAELADLAGRATAYPQVRALCAAQTAALHLRVGELTAAAGCLDEVEVGVLDPRDRLRVLLNRGTLAAHLEPGAGEDDLREAYDVALAAEQPESAFRALHNLGWLAFLRGDLPEALTLMHRADALETDVDRTVALLDRARVELEAGLVWDARNALRAAADGARDAGQQHTLGEIELELSRTARLTGDAAESVAACGRARALFEDLGSHAWAARARLAELVATAEDPTLSGDRAADIAEELRVLGGQADAHGDRLALVESTLARGRLALLADDPGAADAAVESVGGLRGAGGVYLTTRLAMLALRTRAALARGDRPQAARLLRRASDEVALARHRPASLDLRTALGLHARALADLDVDLAVGTGRADALLAASERWRGTNDVLPAVRPPADPRSTDLVRSLRALKEDVRLAPPEVDTRPILARARRLEQEVRELDWSGGSAHDAGRRPTRVPTREIVATLARHGRGLVSFVPVGDRLHVVVIAPGSRPRQAPPVALAPLRELVARVRADVTALATARVPGPLMATVQGALREDLADLARRLVAPALAMLDDDVPLVVVPTTDLGNVPWGMLPGTRGRPLVVSRSASAWSRTADDEVGGPGAGVRVGALAGPGLPLADVEAEAVAAAYAGPSRTVAAAESSAAALAGLLADSEVVHIAAHGVHDHENPLFSHVRTREGPAFAHEFLHDKVAARHVVLATCEGGRASYRPGEEALGFAATLLSRGVGSVVAPTCVVPDEDAHALVVEHHRQLAAGVDAVTALARATAAAPLLAGSFTAFGTA